MAIAKRSSEFSLSGHELCAVDLLGYQLMMNHWHMVLKGGIATKGLGHAQVAIPLAPKLYSPWPIARLPNWVARVNEPLSEQELDAVRRCVRRGIPRCDASWVKTTAHRLGLESTLSPRGRESSSSSENTRQ